MAKPKRGFFMEGTEPRNTPVKKTSKLPPVSVPTEDVRHASWIREGKINICRDPNRKKTAE
jgi:hypothetical protein